MARQQRQLDQLRTLCTSGDVARAVDLAFEHFARFGRDEEVLELITRAVERTGAGGQTRRQLGELATGRHPDPASGTGAPRDVT